MIFYIHNIILRQYCFAFIILTSARAAWPLKGRPGVPGVDFFYSPLRFYTPHPLVHNFRHSWGYYFPNFAIYMMHVSISKRRAFMIQPTFFKAAQAARRRMLIRIREGGNLKHTIIYCTALPNARRTSTVTALYQDNTTIAHNF